MALVVMIVFSSAYIIQILDVGASNVSGRAEDVGSFKEVYGAWNLSEMPTISVSGGNAYKKFSQYISKPKRMRSNSASSLIFINFI